MGCLGTETRLVARKWLDASYPVATVRKNQAQGRTDDARAPG
jgi:hypothetical protein